MKIIAVTSGKGGVGKTNLSANLAIQLSSRGQRVLVFDGDIGLANLDVVLGSPAPYKLQHVLSREKRLTEVIFPAAGGIHFIAGGSGLESLINLDGPSGDQFLSELNCLESSYDYLIFDTGAGIDGNVLTFVSAADDVLLVATPDPASMTDAYATAKAVFITRPEAHVYVVMNMVSNDSEGRQVFAKLTSVTQQFLGKALHYAGCVRMDIGAMGHIRARTPYCVADPTCAAAQDVDRLAAFFLGQAPPVYMAPPLSLGDRLRNLFGLKSAAKISA